MEALQIAGVIIVAFLAGLEGILDQFQFHQPIIACTLIGVVTGHPVEGLALGGSLQLIALGWMNIGAAVAPDAALASVASAILVCMKGLNPADGIAAAIPMAVAGLALTALVRTITVFLVHIADGAASKGNIAGVEGVHYLCLLLQGLRIVIPAVAVLLIPKDAVMAAFNALPEFVSHGLAVAGGAIVVVGYAMVVNMMASKKTWPFFFIGFVLACLTDITLIGFGILGVCIALIYMQLSPEFNGGSTAVASAGQQAGSSDALDDILNDYE